MTSRHLNLREASAGRGLPNLSLPAIWYATQAWHAGTPPPDRPRGHHLVPLQPPHAMASSPRTFARTPDGLEWVSPSEINEVRFCERRYHLERVQQIRPDAAGQARLARGTAGHAAHGTRVTAQRRWTRIAAGIAFLAALVVLLLLASGGAGGRP